MIRTTYQGLFREAGIGRLGFTFYDTRPACFGGCHRREVSIWEMSGTTALTAMVDRVLAGALTTEGGRTKTTPGLIVRVVPRARFLRVQEKDR